MNKFNVAIKCSDLDIFLKLLEFYYFFVSGTGSCDPNVHTTNVHNYKLKCTILM